MKERKKATGDETISLVIEFKTATFEEKDLPAFYALVDKALASAKERLQTTREQIIAEKSAEVENPPAPEEKFGIGISFSLSF